MTIKELRQITGLSQKAFGEKYHIPKRSIENWEGGQRQVSETILYLLERVVREDYNMAYVLIDDCTTKRASVFEQIFKTEKEAIEFANAEWEVMPEHNKKVRDAYYVASCTLDEDGELDWESIEPIKEFK